MGRGSKTWVPFNVDGHKSQHDSPKSETTPFPNCLMLLGFPSLNSSQEKCRHATQSPPLTVSHEH